MFVRNLARKFLGAAVGEYGMVGHDSFPSPVSDPPGLPGEYGGGSMVSPPPLGHPGLGLAFSIPLCVSPSPSVPLRQLQNNLLPLPLSEFSVRVGGGLLRNFRETSQEILLSPRNFLDI